MRWKLISLLIVVFLFSTSVLAESTIELESVVNSININEKASFKLTITNKAATTQRYSIFSFVQGWDIEPYPLKDKIIEIGPGFSKSTTITAKPTESFGPGIYSLALNIESDAGEKYARGLDVYINPEKPLSYLPSIKATIDMNTKINPEETQTIKLLLENRNPLNISGLRVNLKSDMPEFRKETTLDMEPLSKKTVEFTVVPNMLQKPGKYNLFFTFDLDEKIINVESLEVEVLPLSPRFELNITQTSSFLKVNKKVEVRNPGNIENTQNVMIPVSFFEGLFSKSLAKVIKKEGQRYLSWETTLSPDETITFDVVHNFRYPLYLLAIILVVLFIYYYTKSPVSLTKTSTSSRKEAGLSELKITLQFKNLTNKNLKNIKIIDLIPGIADIGKGLELGTLKPQEIKHTKKGTLVKWKLAEIDAKEDRLITYQIKSKLKIVGTLKLPRAKAEYYVKKRKRMAYSNTFRISG